MRIVLVIAAMATATMASATSVTVTDPTGRKQSTQLGEGQHVIVDPVTGKRTIAGPDPLPSLKHHDIKGALIDVHKPASADAYFDLSKYSADPRPCGGIKSLSTWGKPPPGVAMYLALCRNGQAYVIAQQLSTGKTRFAKAEHVQR